MDVKVYHSSNANSLYKILRSAFHGLKAGRELGLTLFIRDLKALNRKSIFGYFWILLSPLALGGIWMMLNKQKIISVSQVPMAYSAFALCGTLLWSLFAEAVLRPMSRFQEMMPTIAKLDFPREAILIASFYDILLGIAIRLVIMLPYLWIVGYTPHLNYLGGLAACVGIGVCGIAIGILLTPFSLLYNDIAKGVPIVLPFAMYLTPVIYPLDNYSNTLWQKFNPVTPFLECARSAFGNYQFNQPLELAIWSLITLVSLTMGIILLKIALPVVTEKWGG